MRKKINLKNNIVKTNQLGFQYCEEQTSSIERFQLIEIVSMGSSSELVIQHIALVSKEERANLLHVMLNSLCRALRIRFMVERVRLSLSKTSR